MADCASVAELLPSALRSQLLRDMQHWSPESITCGMLQQTVESDTRALVAIINQTVFLLRPTVAARNGMMTAVLHDLAALAVDFAVPDVVLSLNVFDEPVEPLRQRPLPVFSFFQTRAAADILMPSGYFRTLRVDQMLLSIEQYRKRYPWSGKRPVALWRGSLFCGPNRFLKCSRLVLAHLSAQRVVPELDVGFTTYDSEHDIYLRINDPEPAGDLPLPPSRLQKVQRVSPLEHANSKYLVHLDGYTASSRFQLLLATNSVVLKQDSYFWAYFHSAFRPYVHYIPFWEASHLDILAVLANVTQHDNEMRHLGERASRLARKLFTRRARSLYWLTLLHLYARRMKWKPSLAMWPSAVQWTDWQHRRATYRTVRCKGDELSAMSIADQLDEDLARAQRAGRATHARPGAMAAIPTNGNASIPLQFESDVEKRTMPPETDHAALSGAHEAFARSQAERCKHRVQRSGRRWFLDTRDC